MIPSYPAKIIAVGINDPKIPMTTVFAAAKKQQVKQETKKLEEQSRKMQQEIKDLDEKMIKTVTT